MENTPLVLTPERNFFEGCSTEKIIINYRDNCYEFQADSYSEEILRDIISRSDYDKIIKQASRLMERSWIKKRKNDLIETPNLIISSSVIAIALIFCFIILIIISSISEYKKILNTISILCVSISMLIILFLSFYNFFRKEGKSISLDEIIKLDIDNLFEDVNKVYKGVMSFKYDPDMRNIICRIVKSYRVNLLEQKRYPVTEENVFLKQE